MTGRSRVVIAPNWIGDCVMAIPFARAIRRAYPADRLAVLAKAGGEAIFRAEGSADETIRCAGLAGDTRSLRSGRFDEAWLLPNSFRSAIAPLLAGIPERIGYEVDRRGSLLTHGVAPPRRGNHQLRDYDALLSSRGIEPDLDPPRIAIPEALAERAADALSRAGLDSAPTLVLLAPGAAFGWTKRWPPESYGRLASELLARGLGCGIVIGPGERDLARSAAQAAGFPVPILGEDLDPVELAGTLARAAVVVANDSGPMHLAAAVGTPVVAFFGPTDPGRTGPTGATSRVLDRYVFCSPCYLKQCPYGHECMKEIEVKDALKAVKEVLGLNDL